MLVGHAERIGGGRLTGVTVVLPPPGTVGAVDVRGGGPGTHETDALDPSTLVPTVDAITLTGGSAFGLVSAHGVQQWCADHGRGFAVGSPPGPPGRRPLLVPIVPAAAIFDLGRGGDAFAPGSRPDIELGRLAAASAVAGAHRPPRRGTVGAGTGAMMVEGTVKGGLGTAVRHLPGHLMVGAVAVVNARGTPIDPVTGALFGTGFVPAGLPRPPAPAGPAPSTRPAPSTGPAPSTAPPAPPLNTTLAVVATNAVLDPAQARRTAVAAHDGIARAIVPAHTLSDGDTVFALATGAVAVDHAGLVAVQAAAAEAVLLAVLDAVLAATAVSVPGGPAGTVSLPAYRDLFDLPPG